MLQVLYKNFIVEARSCFLWCDIPTVPLEYTIGTVIFPIYAQIHCNYKWQLHVTATQ